MHSGAVPQAYRITAVMAFVVRTMFTLAPCPIGAIFEP
jgi:hypothetical protein